MTVNLPVHAMSEKCINCPELELDVLTKEKLDLKQIEEGRTTSIITGYENEIKCKNWDEVNETCPVVCKCEAMLKAVKETVTEAVDKAVKTKKTTTRKTTAKKTVSKK